MMQKKNNLNKQFVIPDSIVHKNNFLFGSSFQKYTQQDITPIQKNLKEITQQLTIYAHNLIQSNTHINFQITHQISTDIPEYIRIIGSIYLYLVKHFSNNKKYSHISENMQKNLLKIKMKFTLWKAILEIIQKKLIPDTSILSKISSIIIFEKAIVENIFFMLSEQQTQLSLEYLYKFHMFIQQGNNINSKKYMYNFLGGSHLSISQQIFCKNFLVLQNFLFNYFQGQNIVMKYLKSIEQKKKDKDNELLQRYIQLVAQYKQKKNIIQKKQTILNYSKAVFKQKSNLQFTEFNLAIIQYQKKQTYHIFTKFFQLIKIQLYIISSDSFSIHTNKQSNPKTNSTTDLSKSKYYLQSLDKLLNKCPYYGNDQCSCKKCQCVRRNRQSAKLSQQKKREAMQKIGPLNERIKQLQKKNYELESENKYLKSILQKFTSHPNFYSVIQQNIQPLKKSLNN